MPPFRKNSFHGEGGGGGRLNRIVRVEYDYFALLSPSLLLNAIRHARTSLSSLFVTLPIATPPPLPRQFFRRLVFVSRFCVSGLRAILPSSRQCESPMRNCETRRPSAGTKRDAARLFIRKINDTVRFLENNVIIPARFSKRSRDPIV